MPIIIIAPTSDFIGANINHMVFSKTFEAEDRATFCIQPGGLNVRGIATTLRWARSLGDGLMSYWTRSVQTEIPAIMHDGSVFWGICRTMG
jgi:hypothetical protein